MSVWDDFCAYQKTHDVTRMRLRDVPSELQDVARTYLSALTDQLNDPENESLDSLGPNERRNALLAVKLKFSEQAEPVIKGDCPRCGGTGYIMAYSHVRGGRCLACDGTGKA